MLGRSVITQKDVDSLYAYDVECLHPLGAILKIPSEWQQFRILYRDFLARIVDLELLSESGDFRKILVQLAAILAGANLVLALHEVARFGLSSLAPKDLLTAVESEVEFLIATTMSVTGLLMVLAWNSVLLNARDCSILGVLPVRGRTIFLARAAGLATFLGGSIAAINLFTGFAFPFFFAAGNGLLDGLRPLAAYWCAVTVAGIATAAVILAVQGVAVQIFSMRQFHRFSAIIQLALFFLIVGVYFIKPSYPNPDGTWVPSFWFFEIFQKLRGTPSSSTVLTGRAMWTLFGAISVAGIAFLRLYHDGVRRMAEQPEISHVALPFGKVSRWLERQLSSAPIGDVVLPFLTRTILRSRQHRLLLAAYYGVGFAFALVYAKDVWNGSYESTFWDLFGLHAKVSWGEPSIPMLVPSLVMLLFGVAGTRAVFACPMNLPANWIFRLTETRDSAEYVFAVRRSLYLVSAAPIWLISAVFYLSLWPIMQALQHLAVLVLIGIILVEISLFGFRKIPFTCSYLPGKANLHLRLGVYAPLFLLFADRGVAVELWTLQEPEFFGLLVLALVTVAYWARRRTSLQATASRAGLIFEDLPEAGVESLSLKGASASPPHVEYPKTSREHEIDEEVEFHLRMATQERAERGEHPAEAKNSALREFGNTTVVKEDIRGVWTWAAWEMFFIDLCQGLKILTHSPGLSLTAIALISMGIGGNTTVYSIIQGILTKPAPGVTADRLVTFGVRMNGQITDPGNSYANFLDYSAQSRTMESMIAFGFGRFVMSTSNGASQLRGGFVTGDYFRTLGVAIVTGRPFTDDEVRGRAPLAAIIAHHIWQQQFHSDPNIAGRNITLNGKAATVVGVTAPGFRGINFAPNLEICVPFFSLNEARMTKGDYNDRSDRGVGIIGRLSPQATLDDAKAEFDIISTRLRNDYPAANRGLSVALAPYSASMFGPWQSSPQVRTMMTLLTLVSLLALFVSCANVSNLMLARALSRQRETAIRVSIGASRMRVIRIFLLESLTLSVAAAGCAWAFAFAASRAANLLVPPLESGAQLQLNLMPDWRVALYALLLALLCALSCTIAGSLRVFRHDPLECLKAGENIVISGSARLARALVIVQLSMCVVLLTAGGLALRSASLLEAEDLSFQRENVLLAAVNTSTATSSSAEHLAMLGRMQEKLQTLPGVKSVSYALAPPPQSHSATGVAVRATAGASNVYTDLSFVGPDYLSSIGVPILAGRGILEQDIRALQPVTVINQKLAAALWPGQSPLGRTILVGSGNQFAVVVGVVPNGAFNAVGEGGSFRGLSQSERLNFMFLLEHDGPARPGPTTLHIRHSGGEFQSMAENVRLALHEVDPRVPVFSMRSMEQEWRSFTAPIRLAANILGLISAGALIISSIGLYAVIAFYTARRKREFAVRIALGAAPVQTLRAVLTEGLVLAAIGFAIGFPLTAALGRGARNLLFGITPADPLTHLAVMLILLFVSLTACLVPAWNTLRIDPAKTLRQT